MLCYLSAHNYPFFTNHNKTEKKREKVCQIVRNYKEHQEVLKGGGKKSYEKGRPNYKSGENEFWFLLMLLWENYKATSLTEH